MKKALPIILLALPLAACKTVTQRPVTEAELPNVSQMLAPHGTLTYTSKWKQPTNKKEPCEILFEGWAPMNTPAAPNSQLTWDGQCKNGKADGLGMAVQSYGSIDTYEIAHLFEGISEQYFYQYTPSQSQATYGRYIREAGKNVRRQVNVASTDAEGKISFVYFSGTINDQMGTSTGINYRSYTDGKANLSGNFGSDFFFGIRDNYSTNSVLQSKIYGSQTMNAEQLVGYIIRQSMDGRVWYERYENGILREHVVLPETFYQTALSAYNDGSTHNNQANQAAQMALSIKAKYDALSGHSKQDQRTPEQEQAPESSMSTGTGFFVSNDGYLLTNSHVVNGAEEFFVILEDQTVSATLIDQDVQNDIALLKIDRKVNGLPVDFKNKAKQGLDISVLGFPNIGIQGNEQKATFGHINANSGIQGDTRFYQISAPIQPGNSGSPILNDQGSVIGVATSSLNQGLALEATGTLAQNVNYGVKIAYALPMLVTHNVKYRESNGFGSVERTKMIDKTSPSVVLVVAKS